MASTQSSRLGTTAERLHRGDVARANSAHRCALNMASRRQERRARIMAVASASLRICRERRWLQHTHDSTTRCDNQH